MVRFVGLQRENINKAVIVVEGDPPDIDELVKRLALGTAVQVPVAPSATAKAPDASVPAKAPGAPAQTGAVPAVAPVADPKTTRARAAAPAPVVPVAPVVDEDGNEVDDDDAPPSVGVLFTGAVPNAVLTAEKISPMVTALLQSGVLPAVTGQAGVDAVVQWCTEAFNANAVPLLKRASKDLADMQTRVKRSASLALGVST
jgi:hypothetical protein